MLVLVLIFDDAGGGANVDIEAGGGVMVVMLNGQISRFEWRCQWQLKADVDDGDGGGYQKSVNDGSHMIYLTIFFKRLVINQ